MKQVAPLETRPVELSKCDDGWRYDLRPSHPMPTLELKRSIKSELCSAGVSRVLRAIDRYPLTLLLAYFVTLSSYIVVMVAPAAVGRLAAPCGLLAGLPTMVFSLTQLRYDLVKLLLATFDVWFTTVMLTLVFVTLAFMLDDWRALSALSLWLGSWPNTMNDAGIIGIRSVVILSTTGIFVSGAIALAINFNLTDQPRDFEFFRYRDHVIHARSVISDGFINIMAVMIRNAYRRRNIIFRRRATTSELECIIYRCQLRLVKHQSLLQPKSKNQVHPPSTQARDLSSSQAGDSRYIQKMRHIPLLQSIDIRETVVPIAFTKVMSSRPHRSRLLACLLIASSFASTLCASAVVMVGYGASSRHNGLATAACTLTVLHSLATVALYHRQLVVMIYTSFDFVFFIVQVDFVAIVVCDLFSWRLHTVLLTVTVLLWIHWVMLLDALTPLVRQRLHIHRYFPRLVFACCFSAGIALVYSLIFANPPAQIHDRLLWSGVVLGHTVSFRLLPQFYSSLATVFFLSLRFGWCHCWLDEDELVVLDGHVQFTNPFHRFIGSSLRPTRSTTT